MRLFIRIIIYLQGKQNQQQQRKKNDDVGDLMQQIMSADEGCGFLGSRLKNLFEQIKKLSLK